MSATKQVGPLLWNISLINVDAWFFRTMEMVSNFPMFSFCMFVNRDVCAAWTYLLTWDFLTIMYVLVAGDAPTFRDSTFVGNILLEG
jgi:hypothetical protein